jgi:hypothetical protein
MVTIGYTKYTEKGCDILLKKVELTQKSNKKIKNKRISYFFTSFALTLAIAGTVAGIIIVDQNSRNIGWSDQKASLAFSSNNKKMDFSIAGGNYKVDLTYFDTAQEIINKYQTSYNLIKPVPNKLIDEAIMFLEPKMAEIFSKIYYSN